MSLAAALATSQSKRLNVPEASRRKAELKEKMAALYKGAAEHGRDLTAEEIKSWSALNAEVAAIDARLAEHEAGRMIVDASQSGPSAETWRTREGRPVTVLAKGDSAVSAFAGQSRPNFSFGEFVRAMVKGSSNPEILAALSEGGGTGAGAVTVPTILLPGLIDNLRAKSVCIGAGAQTVLLDTNETNIARISADPTPAWRSESAAFSESAPTFEKVSFTPQSLGVLVKVSGEILEDSVNLDQALSMAFAGAFGVEFDRVALFGSGVAPQPHGISGTANVGSVSMGVNGAALTNYDPIIDAVASLLTANANSPTAAVMHPRTLTKLAKLKDSQNQPLRRPDLLANLPFLSTTGVPVNQTQGTANTASEIIVGDFSQLMFGVRHSLRISVLRERFWADAGQIGFVADLRADVQLRHPQSFCEVVGVL